MSKAKSAFFCTNCGHESPKWIGKCPSCLQWNSFAEEIVDRQADSKGVAKWNPSSGIKSEPLLLNKLITEESPRIVTEDSEINRVLGSGIVLGSIILAAGEPGIGKSTLFLQLGLMLQGKKVLYISGEESVHQIKMRANRMAFSNDTFYVLTETALAKIFSALRKIEPEVVIVDSIQTVESSNLDSTAGSVSQIKECTAGFLKYAKETNTPVILIGHITKDGAIAGPKILEHMVDVVLQFEGDRNHSYRILRTIKNRFGSTAELGIYEMTETGMRIVQNPSELLLSPAGMHLSGAAIGATIEGMRPLLIEAQALVGSSNYPTPQRTSSGFDIRRLQLLLAVLEKRGGFHFSQKDVFINMVGGIKSEDPALDLSIAAALLSSNEDVPLRENICFAGEIGLNGEIRPVSRMEQRIAEASRLGFTKIYCSGLHKDLPNKSNIEVVKTFSIDHLFKLLF